MDYDTIFNDGYDAAYYLYDYDNPYPINTWQHVAWNDGYAFGENESIAEMEHGITPESDDDLIWGTLDY